MRPQSRDRITIELRGLGVRLHAHATVRQMTTAALAGLARAFFVRSVARGSERLGGAVSQAGLPASLNAPNSVLSRTLARRTTLGYAVRFGHLAQRQ
jgi:hypothetical protein